MEKEFLLLKIKGKQDTDIESLCLINQFIIFNVQACSAPIKDQSPLV